MNESAVILVVDDDPRIAEALILLLRTCGFRAVAASDALEAVALARASKPEVILMDVMMPGMDGSVAAALLKDTENLKDIPIILVSALPEEDLQAVAAEVGAAGYVCKPFRRIEILRALHNALMRRHLEQVG